MKHFHSLGRLVLGASLALSAVLTAAAPAAAGGGQGATVDTRSTCDAFEVTIDPGDTRRTWHITATTRGGPWSWGGTGTEGQAPGSGWVADAAVTVPLPQGADMVTVAWWHGRGDPDLDATRGWKTVVDGAGWRHPGGDACGLPEVRMMAADCASVELQFSNPTRHLFSGDVRVDGEPGTADQWSDMVIAEGPLAGELFGNRFRKVDIPPSTGRTHRVQFKPGSGEHLVEWVIRRGAEQRWYVAWDRVLVDCGEPTPSPSPTPTLPGGGSGPQDTDPASQQDLLPETSGERTALLFLFAAGAFLFTGGLLAVIARLRRRRFIVPDSV